jgi:hypothetical protein
MLEFNKYKYMNISQGNVMPSRKNIFSVDSDFYSASLFDENLKEPFIPVKLIKQFLMLVLTVGVLLFAYRYVNFNMDKINAFIVKVMPTVGTDEAQTKESFFALRDSEKIEKVLKPSVPIEKELERKALIESVIVKSGSVTPQLKKEEVASESFYFVDEYIEAINKIIRE